MTRPKLGPFAVPFAIPDILGCARAVGCAGLLGCAGAALLGVACDDKKTQPAAILEAGVADKYATADPRLEKALQAAASASPPSENGPPADGIFAPGVADKRHPKGDPTKVDILNEGAEPRVDLGGGASPGDSSTGDAARSSYGPALMELAMQTGPRSAAPTVDLGLMLGPAKKEGGEGAGWLIAEVQQASPAAANTQLGELPQGTEQAIAMLRGSQARVKLTADGRESDVQSGLSKQAPPDLERLAQNAAEALVFATIPLPGKPVGVGAQWIAETRMPLSGLDVISYRAYKIKAIDGRRVQLSMDVKAYATGPSTQLQGLPKEATLQQVDAQGQGEMELVRGEILARKSNVQQRIVLTFQTPNPGPQPGEAPPPDQPQPPPGAMMKAQLPMLSQATFVRGEDLRAALHPGPGQ
jgi:hypothetical protein